MCSGYDMKVWLGKVFLPGHRQLMCCALSPQAKGKGERNIVHRCKKEYNELFVCSYES